MMFKCLLHHNVCVLSMKMVNIFYMINAFKSAKVNYILLPFWLQLTSVYQTSSYIVSLR